MADITVSLDEEFYVSPLLGTSVDVSFTLKKGGNKNGNLSVYTVNTPTSLTFSADFEASDGSPTLDNTKLVKIWITYDEIANKAIYKLEQLTAI